MVANSPARRAPVAAALLVCLLFVTPSAWAQVGSVPTTPAQLYQLQLNMTTTKLSYQGQSTVFFNANNTVTFSVEILNTGSDPAPAGVIPAYFFLNNTSRTTVNQCTLISQQIPAAVTDPQTQITTPGRLPFTYTFTMPDQPVVAPAWNASFYLNRAPPPGTIYEPCKPGNVASPGYVTHGPTGQSDVSSIHADSEHEATLFFVRDRRIDYQVTGVHWCTADGNLALDAFPDASACSDIVPQPDPVNNKNKTTSATSADSRTFFKVDVTNVGSWADNMSPSGAPWRFPFTISVLGANRDSTYDPLQGRPAILDAGQPSYVVGSLDLNHTYGNYTVAFGLNKFNADSGVSVVPMNTTKTTIGTTVEVAAYDFVAGINATEFASDPAHPYPFPFENNEMHVTGSISISNIGTAVPIAKPHVVAWLDTPSNAHFLVDYSSSELYKPLGNRTKDRTVWFPYDVVASSLSANAFYLSPGEHTLHVEVDDGSVSEGQYYEPNATNNVAEIPIYVNTTTTPQVNQGPFLTNDAGALDNATNPMITSIHPHEPFFIQANITEGAPSDNGDTKHLTVTANFSVVGNRSLFQTVPMIYVERPGGAVWFGKVTNLSYLGPGSSQELLATLEARDPFGHALPAPVFHKLTLVKWPIQVINDSDILTAVHEDAELRKNDTVEFPYEAQTPSYQMRVYRDWTGFISNGLNASQDQILKVDNLALTLYPPKNDTPVVLEFLSEHGAQTTQTGRGGVSNTLGGTTGNPWNTTYQPAAANYLFLSSRELSSQRAGLWHVVINITDFSGEIRHIYRNFTLKDQLPVLQGLSVIDISDNKNDTKSANAGDTVQIHVNASDDFDINPGNVYSVWTRKSDNYTMNFTLIRAKPAPAEADHKAYNYSDTFRVGRDLDLNRSGSYLVRFVAQDINGNWNTSLPVEYALNETGRVQFNKENGQTGADPSFQELHAPVTFFAHAASQYNPRVLLTVSRDGVIIPDLDHVPMNVTAGTGQDENFTLTSIFNISGVYTYSMDLIPSAGGSPADSATGTVTVSDNLGPRIQLRSPSFQAGGYFYAPSAPLLSFLAYDEQGVDNTTFNLTVNGVNVHPVVSPAPVGLKGYYFEYSVPNSEGLRFVDGQHVEVNASVFDLTGLDPTKQSLQSFFNFTFVVDARPPGAKITDFSPRYKSGASTLNNVSLATKFTITASKDDDSPVPIDRIVYTIVGGGRSVTSTYNGPFTLADNKDVYAGSTVYTISVWAYDAVGNSNVTHPQLASFFLDDQTPRLAFKQVRDRYVNLTVVDDQTGVKSVTLWARVGTDLYTPIGMTKDAVGDVWRGMLPEAKRGSIVSWYAQAVDNVDNNLDNTDSFGSAANPYDSYTVPNHEPTVKITSPSLGGRVSRAIDITWAAADADSDPLTFTVFYKAPGRDTYTELVKLDNSASRKYSFDTSTLADGEYTFRVAVTDGTVSRSDETTVTIINSGSAIGAVKHPESVLPGDTVLLTAEIRKAGATVEAQLYRDGKIVETYIMNDEGRDGDVAAADHIYSANVPISASGDYSVTILAHYPEDGQTRTSEQVNAATFSAKLTPSYILATYAGLLILLALLAVVGIALAIFVVVRRKG